MQNYIAPELDLEAFNCPHCRVYAKQEWFFMDMKVARDAAALSRNDHSFRVSYCAHCRQPTIWLRIAKRLVYPSHATAELPNEDLPHDIQDDYDEARSIANLSPRGAAALLRLAIQKLCVHLGQPGKDLNKDIGALVAEGLPPNVQPALDIVRVIGNEAVHPGVIDLRDDPEIVNKLFKLVNLIAAKMISEPKEIAGLVSILPESKLKGIAARDGKTTGPTAT